MTSVTDNTIKDTLIHFLGENAVADFYYLEHRRVILSEVKMITMTCEFCGVEISGLREDVYSMLAQHDYGHAKEVAMMQNMIEDKNDGDEKEGGQTI